MKKAIRGKVDKAYIAGLVDGEGCIGVYKRLYKNNWSPRYSPYVAINNTNQAVLKWVQSLYGGNLVAKKRYALNHKIGYALQIRNNNLKTFIQDITPYLRIKAKQAQLVLEFWLRMKKFFGDYGRSRQRLSPKELKKRDYYYQQTLILNNRPQRLTEKTPKGDVIV